MGEAFRFKTPSSILVVSPSGFGKTCFTESLLLDHSEELFVSPHPTIHYCYGVWQNAFREMEDAGVQFHEGILESGFRRVEFWCSMISRRREVTTELLDLFTEHSYNQNITVLYLSQDMFPSGKYAKSISRNAHYIVAFKNPQD